MSTTIDQKVVEMQFDNKQFESNVQTSLSTLDKLKKSLNFNGVDKSFENVTRAAGRCDMSGLGNAVQNVHAKFTALEVMAVTALGNITNTAVNAGKRIVSALTIDPIKTGFQEYETQINAIQTILANTESKGTTLTDVNKALDELNQYADKTIYNFSQMTKNIGTFTAAGVDLDTSVAAIKGIANLAAVSGSNSQQASTAMYQLSQALSSGTVKLMDWNSVVNAGMGGQVFQDALKETARVHDINIDKMIKDEGSFRETLQKGWLTSAILTETLSKFTGDLNEEQLKSMGYTDEQIKGILKMGQTANDAATKVKTFTQLFDTLKEAAQSGWTQSWEIIVGDFEEAKKLLTEVSDTIGGIIGESAEARNALLKTWKELGGRTDLIEGFRNVFLSLKTVCDDIGDAFRQIFEPLKPQQLADMTKAFKVFTEKMKKWVDNNGERIISTFKGIFAVFGIVTDAIKVFASWAGMLISKVWNLNGNILEITSSFGEWLVNLRSMISEADVFNSIFEKISGFVTMVSDKIKNFISTVKFKFTAPGFEGFYNVLKGIWGFIQKLGSGVASAMSNLASSISDVLSFENLDKGMYLFQDGLFAGILLGLNKFISTLTGGLSAGTGILGGIKTAFDSLGGCLKAYQEQLKADILLKIAAAVGILAASLLIISAIDPDRLQNSVVAIGALFAALVGSTSILGKMGTTMKDIGKTIAVLLGASVSILIASVALSILAGALLRFSTIPYEKLDVIALSLVISLGSLAAALKFMKGTTSGAISLLIASSALIVLAGALHILSLLKLEGLGVGLLALCTSLSALMLILYGMKESIPGSIALIIAANALIILGGALHILAALDLEGLGIAVLALSTTLGLLTLSLYGMKESIPGSLALLIASAALVVLGGAMHILGALSWDKIIRSLVVLAGTFIILGVAGAVLGPMVPAILGLAGAFALIGLSVLAVGVGLTAAGVGLTLLATGFLALGTAMATGATAMMAGLTVIFTGIINLIPLAIAKLVEGFTTSTATIVKLVATALVGILETLADNMPIIIDKALNILVAVLEGIRNNLSKVVVVSLEIVAEFIKGISEGLPKVVQAGFDLLIGFITGIADAIDKNTTPLINALKKLFETVVDSVVEFLTFGAVKDFTAAGKNIISGLIKGMGSMISKVVETARDLAKTAVDTVKKWLGINSPSTVFAEIGRYSDEGMAEGLKKYANSVSNAATNVGKGAINSMSNAINSMSTLIDQNMDMQPTIRPVFDLSGIRTGTTALNKMTSGLNGYSLSGSVNLAESSSRDMQARQIAASKATTLDQLKETIKAISGQNSMSFTNEFNITGDNPREIANEISRIIQQQIERKEAVWE